MTRFLPTTPYRGTRDFLPEEMSVRTQVFSRLYGVIESFGFQRYDGPVLESVEIYEAKSGVELAEKQLYQLTDKADRRLALRPEMTPSVARIIAGNAGKLQFPVRWYSHPNCHRYEKPQKGRVREHWQINVDIFGSESEEAEVEIFELIHAMMKRLGAGEPDYELRVNDRELMFSALERYASIGQESQKSVLSILDRFDKLPREVVHEQLAGAGLDATAIERVEQLVGFDTDAFLDTVADETCENSPLVRILRGDLVSAPVKLSPLIVRGLDYYTSTVFEVFDTSPDNRRSIFGGGRYGNLTELFSKQRIPGIGFGMGDVTLLDFLATHDLTPAPDVAPQVVVIGAGEEARPAVRRVTASLRTTGLRVLTPLEPKGMGKELKKAAQRGAFCAVLAGGEEAEREAVILRDLRRSEQREVAMADLEQEIRGLLGGDAS